MKCLYVEFVGSNGVKLLENEGIDGCCGNALQAEE